MAGTFDLCGALRRIRRIADLSQRELASAAGTSAATIARAESGTRDLPMGVLTRAAALAGLRLALLDAHGQEVAGMDPDGVRDMGYRRFPAHLDTRYGDEEWWHGPERYSRPQPWYTFDRRRSTRDYYRWRDGTPGDHQLPQPGDSPADRRARRREEALREWQEKMRLWAPLRPPELPELICTCPPECEGIDDPGVRPRHAEACPCRCDIG